MTLSIPVALEIGDNRIAVCVISLELDNANFLQVLKLVPNKDLASDGKFMERDSVLERYSGFDAEGERDARDKRL